MLTSMMDKDDILILRLLQHDGRMTNKEIADKIGKSVSPVYERIKKLENDGIIQQYVALLDRRKINRNLCAAKGTCRTCHVEIRRRVTAFSEVMECYHMTGQYDYLLKVVVKDMDEYYLFIIERLSRLKNVGTVQSFFVLNEAKKDLAYRLSDEVIQTKSAKETNKTNKSAVGV